MRKMKAMLISPVAVAIAIAIALVPASNLYALPCSGTLQCAGYEKRLEDCRKASYETFSKCVIDCGVPPPLGLTQLACLAACEIAWIARDAVCLTNWATCDLVMKTCSETPETGFEDGSPILLDLDRNNFHLTGLNDGVVFDIFGTGQPVPVSWTAGESSDGFLFRDRNGNGVVDDGTELFGNHTPLLSGMRAPNGYIALGELDLPQLGGNADRFIDESDAVYNELGIWLDRNHNGLSEFGELTSLKAIGVTRIGVAYRPSNRVDQHGNRFISTGDAWVDAEGHSRRIATTDIVFVIQRE